MRIGAVSIGGGSHLALVSGLNVLEKEEAAVGCAREISRLAAAHGFPIVFKASFDKANRTRVNAYRGPGLDEGLHVLRSVRQETGLPVLTDVHDVEQARAAARVVDCLQIPAFLCRQTDLVAACAGTGLPINLKKGQFVAPRDIRHAVEKCRAFGARGVMVTDRGASFGYNDLVADMRGLVQIRGFAPVCFDATHACQSPGTQDGASGGDRCLVAPLARAAVAVGVDALFVEAHPDPERAPCDGATQIDYRQLDRLLGEVRAIEQALRPLRAPGASPGRPVEALQEGAHTLPRRAQGSSVPSN